MMTYTTIKRAGAWLARLSLFLSTVCIVLIMCVTVVEVVGRYMFNAPLFGRQDIAQILLALSIFLAFPVVTLRGGQIDVDLMDFMFSPKAAFIRDRLIEILISLSLLTMGYWLLTRAEKALSRGIVSELLFIPKYPLIYIISGAVFLTGVLVLILMLSRLFKGKPDIVSGSQEIK
ncbi:TRAP transporter small permease [Lentilitoribacter sp. EG35]|uniref:TRAP transporter small permease n=1 Tax=Lentilitoribacter sp. EG35 TaxID=3234192 RepID=UPI003460F462